MTVLIKGGPLAEDLYRVTCFLSWNSFCEYITCRHQLFKLDLVGSASLMKSAIVQISLKSVLVQIYIDRHSTICFNSKKLYSFPQRLYVNAFHVILRITSGSFGIRINQILKCCVGDICPSES
jgi:hypothetical protein